MATEGAASGKFTLTEGPPRKPRRKEYVHRDRTIQGWFTQEMRTWFDGFRATIETRQGRRVKEAEVLHMAMVKLARTRKYPEPPAFRPTIAPHEPSASS
jgi:hypothetical protein